MLGAGGFIRAYTDGAVAGIEAADPITQVLHQEVSSMSTTHGTASSRMSFMLEGFAWVPWILRIA